MKLEFEDSIFENEFIAFNDDKELERKNNQSRIWMSFLKNTMTNLSIKICNLENEFFEIFNAITRRLGKD